MASNMLLVEDEALIAMDIESDLSGLGLTVTLAETVAAALEQLASAQFDLAILDYELHGLKTTAVADRLSELRVPFVVCSGSTMGDLGPSFAKAALINKPFRTSELLAAVQSALSH